MKPFEKAIEYIEHCVDTKEVCSAALAIGIKDKLYVKRCFGNTSFTEEAEPVNENTIYDMASVSKILSTTMIALRYIAAGKIDLMDTLPRHLGDIVPDDKKDLCIFQLMTHTAGFVDHLLIEEKTDNPDDAIKVILDAPLAYEPGTRVVYSCMGYIILGKILEKVGGKTLDILAQEEVFEPLGMKDTGYHVLGKGIDYSAHTCFTERNHITGEWLVGEVHDENCYFLNGVSGNAGIFSNLNDMIRYGRMLANLGTLEGQVYLPKTIMETAIKCHTSNLDERKGLGFHLSNGHDSMSGVFFTQDGFGHNGYTGPSIFVDPHTGLYVILLLNRVHPTRENAAHLRMRRILHTLATIGCEELNK